MKKSAVVLAEQERLLFEEAWLNFFNSYLLERRVITKQEFYRMSEKIICRTRTRSKKY